MSAKERDAAADLAVCEAVEVSFYATRLDVNGMLELFKVAPYWIKRCLAAEEDVERMKAELDDRNFDYID